MCKNLLNEYDSIIVFDIFDESSSQSLLSVIFFFLYLFDCTEHCSFKIE